MVRLRMPSNLFNVFTARLRTGALLLLGILLTAENCFSQQEFPYVAYVVKDGAHARSGPDQRHYPTQQLPQGFAVEVYRHDEGGWCAIRPPEGSFSWISSHEVRPAGDNIAEVIAEVATPRVGSTLSPSRTAVQVLLPRGELVQMHEAITDGAADWFPIAAPTGEFRWIEASSLARQVPLEINAPAEPNKAWPQSVEIQENQTAPAVQPDSHLQQTNAFEHLLHAPSTGHPQNGIASTVQHAPSDQLEIVAGTPADLQLAQFQHTAHQSPTAPNLFTGSEISNVSAQGIIQPNPPRVRFDGSSPSAGPLTMGTTSERVQELELLLSQSVTQPPPTWNLDPLAGEAQSLLAVAETPQDRTQLRAFLDRIARFQGVHSRYTQSGPPQPRETELTSPTSRPPVDPIADIVHDVRQRVREDFSGGANRGRKQTASAPIDEPLYDAVGMLKEVVSRKEKAPRYALVNTKGNVVSFVTPTPELNLQPYIGRHVGVQGTRGFMTDYRRAHVTASRITPVSDSLRR